jgi:hypothetical protein
MSMPGLGAMIHILGGGSKEDPKKYIGKTIKKAEFSDNAIYLSFDDKSSIRITDNGQSCCETRYMTTSDDFSILLGNKLTGIKVREYKEVEADHETHEIAFLEIATDKNSVTVETHNEHNGYYGGFGLNIEEIKNGK